MVVDLNSHMLLTVSGNCTSMILICANDGKEMPHQSDWKQAERHSLLHLQLTPNIVKADAGSGFIDLKRVFMDSAALPSWQNPPPLRTSGEEELTQWGKLIDFLPDFKKFAPMQQPWSCGHDENGNKWPPQLWALTPQPAGWLEKSCRTGAAQVPNPPSPHITCSFFLPLYLFYSRVPAPPVE